MRAGRAGRAWQAGMLGARGRGKQAAWALGGTGAGARQQARQQAGRACVGARTGAGARQGARAAGARGVRSRGAAWALGARPGRLGWP